MKKASALPVGVVFGKPVNLRHLPWLIIVILSFILAELPRTMFPRWVQKYPPGWRLPLADWISGFMHWLTVDAHLGPLTVSGFTRALSFLLDLPLQLASMVLATGVLKGQGSEAVMLFPPVPWFALIIAVAALSWMLRGWRLAVGMTIGFLYLAVFGQWTSAMVTLASVLVAALLSAAGGLALGLLCVRSATFGRILSPLLDVAQTMPVFAYLLPMLILFGFGPVSAMIATVIYAIPPMVRVTVVAIQGVPDELRSLGSMTGCTRRQMTWRILLPTALPGLMVGVNQVIMLSLNVVIIASMIGAGGLGWDVLGALRRLDIGGGLEAGLAITVLAVMLDRFAQALVPDARRSGPNGSWSPRLVAGALALAGLLWIAAAIWPAIAHYPDSARLSTGPFWNDLVSWINIHFHDPLDVIKTFMLLHVLMPVKRFMLALPWPWVVAVVTLAGLWMGGIRLALTVGLMCGFMAVVGLWQPAMITLYLCGVSVMIAMLLGVPLGVLATQRPWLMKSVEVFIDTLQTLPAFVYLIPIVMLFRVGDFTAMIGIVLYAIAPAIRYTAHGISQVPASLIEAGIMTGCTRGQILRRIRLPYALPDMLLGLNQTILLALSMLVITALVGTRDLGQVTYAALSKADVGQGVVAGLCVAFIGMISDRFIRQSIRQPGS
ncbi:glycine betaine/carnitine/choline ABC transportsystem permease protein OpuCB1 [Acetobacter aceti NRIC 0242]|uniref:ABC transporter permease n=1 Tax=Acetobacter aceti NBRC 14818 TaxID=887700 RepID=A0AB33IK68_ACEAC|nr:ABC transporter permease subunit [Acetobacter aceti]TCS28404.1 glycine betaine/proline transport system permease protein [Acetobacter aceti NBRC 14818]BCK76317.1 ABC transporter permease [Acetobacter aceti NBRC 14818]GAN58117.1 ABC transporter [Acetobacter aceti NBRC 14818]GBO80527.1 glycine betaine/carnitine/choline ABC transportsystem permease protein OpuCB1 [Acetobacter aceti NRIC 0242]